MALYELQIYLVEENKMMLFDLEVETVELIASRKFGEEAENNFSEIRFTTASADFKKAFLIGEDYAFGGDALSFMHKDRSRVKFFVTIKPAECEGALSDEQSLGDIEFFDYGYSERMLWAVISVPGKQFAAFCEAVQRECRINIVLRNDDLYFDRLNSYSNEEVWVPKDKRQKLPVTDFFMKFGSQKNYHQAGFAENLPSSTQILANVERRLKKINEQNLWILGALVIVACVSIGKLEF